LVESPPNSGNKIILVAGGFRAYQVMTGAATGAYSTSEIYDFGMDSWSAGVNFINFLCTAFLLVDPEIVKITI
jgi:hypothetical protein